MELKAFDLIIEKLTPALLAQEFSAPADYEVEKYLAILEAEAGCTCIRSARRCMRT